MISPHSWNSPAGRPPRSSATARPLRPATTAGPCPPPATATRAATAARAARARTRRPLTRPLTGRWDRLGPGGLGRPVPRGQLLPRLASLRRRLPPPRPATAAALPKLAELNAAGSSARSPHFASPSTALLNHTPPPRPVRCLPPPARNFVHLHRSASFSRLLIHAAPDHAHPSGGPAEADAAAGPPDGPLRPGPAEPKAGWSATGRRGCIEARTLHPLLLHFAAVVVRFAHGAVLCTQVSAANASAFHAANLRSGE